MEVTYSPNATSGKRPENWTRIERVILEDADLEKEKEIYVEGFNFDYGHKTKFRVVRSDGTVKELRPFSTHELKYMNPEVFKKILKRYIG